MNFYRFILQRARIFTLLVVLLPIIAGTYAYQVMPKEGEPEISAPHAIVITPYVGASPSEIESLVTNPIEEELAGLKNVDEIRSSSSEGVSVVVVDFDVNADLEQSLQRVREMVTDVRKDLPDDADDSTVEEISFSDIPIMLVSIIGDLDPVRLKRLAQDTADDLELLPEVLSAEVAGGKTREIHIYLEPERLDQYGLTILDVFNAVKKSDVNIPGGQINVAPRRFLLRTLTEVKKVEDYGRIPLMEYNDRIVFLEDVGNVVDGYSEDISYSRVDGKSSVSIAVKKRAGANILKTSARVRERMKALEKRFPSGIQTVVTADQAKYIRQGFDAMNNSAVFGLIIVICVLYFAMGLRNSVITSLSIPLSLLVTFIFLNVFGLSNNNMVRFALVLCIGLLVDNAIIVVENIYHHFQLGKDRATAIIEGAAEISMPVISATLTTMAAFLPMLLMTGVTGEYMGFLPKTVSIALLASLIVALIANPLILARFMKQKVKKGRIVSPEDDLRRLKKLYVRGVTFALNHRALLVLATLLSLGWAISMVAFHLVQIEMFPDVDFDYIYITIETPAGTEVDVTDAIAKRIEKIVNANVPEAEQVVSTVGTRGQSAYEVTFGREGISNFGEITIELKDGKEFARATHKEIQQRIRPFLDVIPGASIRFRPLQWGPPTPAPVVVNLIGQDLEILRAITARIKQTLTGIPGAIDIKDDFSDAPPELRVKVDRARAASLGVSLESIALSLRAATAGLEVRDFRDELDVSRKYDLEVRYSPESRTSSQMLENFKIRSGTGALVPLSNIAEFSPAPGISEIRHMDRRRIVRITAQNEGRSAVEISEELQKKLSSLDLPEGYSITYGGHHEETAESFASLKLAYMIAFILIFTLLVTQFNSFFQPFAIMTALPLSVVGAMFGLLVTGNNFSIMSFIGLVGLTGIVVNDSIVLVDCINRTRKTGLNIFEAILSAGQQRLRPIISTTVSTIGGILTLTITDELWEGLGVVIIFGIAFATVLTLIVVPVMYSLFENLGYYLTSAFRGPRWSEPPEGKCYYYSRLRHTRLLMYIIIVIQLLILTTGAYFFLPKLAVVFDSTVLRAPTALKFVIEAAVFYIGLVLQIAGVLILLMLPTWIGIVWMMGRRTKEEYYVDVVPHGLNVALPSEKFFLPADRIKMVNYARILGQITIDTGSRKLRVRKVVKARKTPSKIPLKTWIQNPVPTRSEIQSNMEELNVILVNLIRG
jgi:CzcA family heavy metal efflux pump